MHEILGPDLWPLPGEHHGGEGGPPLVVAAQLGHVAVALVRQASVDRGSTYIIYAIPVLTKAGYSLILYKARSPQQAITLLSLVLFNL